MIFLLAAAVLQDEPAFERIFDGRDLAGWTFVSEEPGADPAATFRVEEGALICSGAPAGYLRTDRSFREFTLRFDWRFARPADLADDAAFGGNSGYLVYIAAPGALGVWPRSIEVQGMNRDAGQILPIPRDVRCRVEESVEDRRAAVRPVGEWNSMEIVSREGALTVFVNGVRVAVVTECELTEGPIGFQSEGAEIHWRDIRVGPPEAGTRVGVRVAKPPAIRTGRERVVIETRGARVRYTVDGAEPTAASPVYVTPFEAPRGAVVAAAVLPEDNADLFFARGPIVVRARPTRPKTGWRVVRADSEETEGENGAARNAIDGDPATFWHTAWSREHPAHPHEIVIDVGEEVGMSALGYLPRSDGSPNGTVDRFEFYVSSDGEAWGEPIAAGRFEPGSGPERVVNLPAGTRGRYLRFVALSEVNGNPWTSAAELNVYE